MSPVNRWLAGAYVGVGCAALIFPWWYWDETGLSTAQADLTTAAESAISALSIIPIPESIELPTAKVRLGERLFHDTRLSNDGTIACASCHELARGGTDQAYRSKGINGTLGGINTPTVFNSGFNFRQFWDGRAASLEEQIDGPIQHPDEMGATWPSIVTRLEDDTEYRAAFGALYPGIGIQAVAIKDAIATFERSLITPGSRFDQYLRGKTEALSPEEVQGYRLFTSYGCASCHQGVNLGGNLYQTLGIVGDYFEDRQGANESLAAHLNMPVHDHATHPHRVKVPTLRNIALTAPYFHDGSAETLEEAVQIMGRYQLGRTLSEREVRQITGFLRSLTGTYRGAQP